MCEFLNAELDVDCYTDRFPDKGPFVQMDGDVYGIANYLHTGIDMIENYSSCSTAGLKPAFRSGVSTSDEDFFEENGPFRVTHFPKMTMSWYTFTSESPCTGGPCNHNAATPCTVYAGCQTINSISGACFPDQGFGNQAGFSQNMNVAAESVSFPDIHIAIRGIFAYGKEPSTSYGTVDF